MLKYVVFTERWLLHFQVLTLDTWWRNHHLKELLCCHIWEHWLLSWRGLLNLSNGTLQWLLSNKVLAIILEDQESSSRFHLLTHMVIIRSDKGWRTNIGQVWADNWLLGHCVLLIVVWIRLEWVRCQDLVVVKSYLLISIEDWSIVFWFFSNTLILSQRCHWSSEILECCLFLTTSATLLTTLIIVYVYLLWCLYFFGHLYFIDNTSSVLWRGHINDEFCELVNGKVQFFSKIKNLITVITCFLVCFHHTHNLIRLELFSSSVVPMNSHLWHYLGTLCLFALYTILCQLVDSGFDCMLLKLSICVPEPLLNLDHWESKSWSNLLKDLFSRLLTTIFCVQAPKCSLLNGRFRKFVSTSFTLVIFLDWKWHTSFVEVLLDLLLLL